MRSENGRIFWFATHPIQYQTPLIREINKHQSCEAVFFADDQKGKQFQDKDGFSDSYGWGVDVLEGVNYHLIQSKSSTTKSFFGVVGKWSSLWRFFKKNPVKAVIVNGWFPFCYLQVWVVCLVFRVPFFVRGDSNLLMKTGRVKQFVKGVILRFLFLFPTSFAYVGELNKKFYLSLGVKPSRIFPAYHTVDKPKGRELPKTSSAFVIGFLGKHILKKNLEWLIQAMLAWEQTDWVLKIGGDGPLTQELQRKYTDSRLHWLGFVRQDKLREFYSVLDGFVLPSSYNETWGLVVNEAMECGVPCLVSESVGCAPDLVVDFETGFLFDLNDFERIHNGLNNLQKQAVSSRRVKEHISGFKMEAVAQQLIHGISSQKYS